MLRAGLIRKLASGLYTWLPLGLRIMRKVENIVREEMNRIGAAELISDDPVGLCHAARPLDLSVCVVLRSFDEEQLLPVFVLSERFGDETSAGDATLIEGRLDSSRIALVVDEVNGALNAVVRLLTDEARAAAEAADAAIDVLGNPENPIL